MSSFLRRVHEAKDRYCHETGEWPDQLFLGPAEYMEFKELCMVEAVFAREDARVGNECAGMTIIGLASDGIRAGHTVI